MQTGLVIETGEARSGQPRSQVLEIGALTVQELDDRLCVCTNDGRSFDVMTFFDRAFQQDSSPSFSWTLL